MADIFNYVSEQLNGFNRLLAACSSENIQRAAHLLEQRAEDLIFDFEEIDTDISAKNYRRETGNIYQPQMDADKHRFSNRKQKRFY